MTLQEARTAVQQAVGDDVGITVEAKLQRHVYDHRDPINTELEYSVGIKSMGGYWGWTTHKDLETAVNVAIEKYNAEKDRQEQLDVQMATKLLQRKGYTVS